MTTTTNATTQSYLSEALKNFLAGRVVTPQRTVAPGCSISFLPQTPASYSTNVAPILMSKCVRCHSPGNIAPWAMTNHTIVQLYAPLIKNQVMAGHMPPWHADPFYGPFTNDFSLTPAQTAMLIQWIDEGSPRGGGADPLAIAAPPPTNYPFAWPPALGEPTQILSIPVQSIPAAPGIEAYRYINVTTTFSSDVWLRAAIIKPGNTRVVHHSLVFQGANSGGMGIDGFFSGYVPGYDAVAFPSGTAKFLPKGTVLQFQIHYVRTDRPETDQTQIGLYTTPTAPAYELQTKSAYNLFISIPPNSTYQATAQYPPTGKLTKNILVYEMSPHMHTRGASFKYEAVYLDGTRETLLSVPRYEFAWQALYRLTQPKLLPAGSLILCTAGWDNTPQNQHLMENYIDYSTQPPTTNSLYAPSRGVRFGDQTYDEMFIGYINFVELP